MTSLYEQIFVNNPSHLALLDSLGVIVLANPGWQKAARHTGIHLPPETSQWPGVNYFHLLQKAAEQQNPSAIQILRGISLTRERGETFEAECNCMNTERDARYLLNIKRLNTDSQAFILLTYSDVTVSHAAQREQFTAENLTDQENQRAREIRSLDRLTNPSPLTNTANAFGLYPLSASSPDSFRSQVDLYKNLILLAVEEQIFRGDHGVSARLRQLAHELGAQNAGPRDIIDIHSAAIVEVIAGVSNEKAQFYIEESRVMVLELMGFLASFYRTFVFTQGNSNPFDSFSNKRE